MSDDPSYQLVGIPTGGSTGQFLAKTSSTDYATAFTSTLSTFKEVVYNIGNATGTVSPNIANGTIQKITLTGNITLNNITGVDAGQSMVIILTQDATGSRTLTSSMKFLGGTKTLSTAGNSVDIVSVFYDGTSYYAALGKGYA
jgi:hypothetical protein